MIDIDNNEFFEVFQFPGGEFGIKWKKLENFIHIYLLARINNGNDFIKLLTVTDALYRMGIDISVYIPYFPGARQDRVTNAGEPLTTAIYADIINNQEYEDVSILDPHSDVTTALIDRCTVMPISHILKEIVEKNNYDTILIPDAGASKKMFSYYFPDTEFNKRLTFIQGLKKRCTVTGKLSGFRIVDEIKDKSNVLIVDDICDGGGTFIGLAEELHLSAVRKGIEIDSGLYVTHGIFSRGVDELLFWYSNIYTTTSIRDTQDSRVVVYNI